MYVQLVVTEMEMSTAVDVNSYACTSGIILSASQSVSGWYANTSGRRMVDITAAIERCYVQTHDK